MTALEKFYAMREQVNEIKNKREITEDGIIIFDKEITEDMKPKTYVLFNYRG